MKNALTVKRVPRVMVFLALGLLLLPTFLLAAPLPRVAAQTQYLAATPGYINLGMNTTISVTAPAAGTYTLVVQRPSGPEVTLSETFTSTGQVQTAVYGNSSLGFESLVNQVGTYNVFLEQGSTVVSSTSFYATNKLVITMDMVTGGTCAYIAGADRGQKLIPRFTISYASTSAKITNTDPGIVVTFTAPGNVKTSANWDAGSGVFDNAVSPTWNYTFLGSWSPTATASDAAGNNGTFTYTGSPYVISPAVLSTTVQLVDSKTNSTITSISSGESVTVYATITYPKNAEPVTGFVAPLDVANRGGTVSGVVGYGSYNATTRSFGGKNSGQIASIAFTYSGANGIWVGSFTAGTLPILNSSQTFQIVINSADKASPPNTGSASLNIAPGAPQVASSSSTTTTSTSSTSSSSTSSAITTSIPIWAYAATTISLIIGVIVGFLARKK